MGDLRFDGRVVVVTGAGAGLGRAYALLFASRGAKVVVNDLGGGRHGDGSSSKAADTVVEEIKHNGGSAVADYNSVVEGDKIVKTAINNFGRIDVLVNNAGILRDKSLVNISDQDWDLVHAVHLKGSFKTTQAAFPYFKKQKYGRIIMTTSNAGLYGNFGQANYSAAKMGLVGLANTIAIEGNKYNIYCNTIVPTAASRLTEDILPPDIFNELRPELIAPVVAYLCHESCQENGSIIESAAGWAGRCAVIRSNGSLLRSRVADDVSLENVRDRWAQITDVSHAQTLGNIQDATGALMASLEGLKSEEVDGGLDESDVYHFTNRDIILYALGVGASLSNPNELKYLYESHENFEALPTFYIMPAMQSLLSSNSIKHAIPGKDIGLEQILHGEHYIEVLDEMPQEGQLVSKTRVVEVMDKGSGAAIVTEVETFDSNGKLLFRNQCVVFAVGSGNFGGSRSGTKVVPCQAKPTRNPDASLSQKTTVDQAALYRLSGDRNPLHIDPNMAQVSGFDRPILHGLCTLGYSVRLVLRAFASDDTSLFRSVKARFVKPVLPGQTLNVSMWREGNRVFFETTVAETKQVVIAGDSTGGGGFLNNTTTQADTPAKKDGVRRLQSVVPVVVRQIKESQEDEFKLFGMSTQILNIVGVLRNFEVLSTKATYTIQDHTGEIKAIWWLENDEDNTTNLPNVKEGSYVQVFGSLRNQDGEKILMVLRMFLVEDNNMITSHLLQVIHTRLASEAMQKNSESTIKANNPGAELANSMSFMNDNPTDSGMGGLTSLQEKVYKILQTNKTPQGMDRATLLNNFSANQHRQVNEALEFLNNEGHAYSTVDNDHFKVTDA